MRITSKEGKVFRRIHDGVIMGDTIILGYDFSTGKKREDKKEYYEEVDIPEIEDSRPEFLREFKTEE